ncbi:peptidase T [uncultured Tyzzerella sp.]|uniref:peptidase T n=1 Tax=uncultured Tyzzerella sp. TaxID=2321398 RepID=UPI00294334DA|nr:peptidase T [uncultured Tyzzerella sp.]
MNIEKTVVDNFCTLIKYDTTSDPYSSSYPSTQSQRDFSKVLAKKCEDIGLEDVKIDKNGYVIATLKATTNKNVPKIGFISHMDTSPDYSGKDIKPNIIENYDGKDIVLKNIVLSPEEFPSLNKYIGKKLITTDGTTLLGADDKAGVAEILTAFEYLKNNPKIEHGEIKLAFTPDEEVGNGVTYFNVKDFDCDFAYTIDGGSAGEINYENFNAANATINITGKNVHPGYATNVMINSTMVANEFLSMLPNETPSNTKGYEGFYHLSDIKGNVEKTTMDIIIRAFDKEEFKNKKQTIIDIVSNLNKKYNNLLELNLEDSYFNMYDILKDNMNIVEKAKNAIQKTGLTPYTKPIRGGTDGARLSFMGLPCPNIFAGGHNFHGPYEYVCVDSMVKAVEVIINIATDI